MNLAVAICSGVTSRYCNSLGSGFVGADQFTYTISDGYGGTATCTNHDNELIGALYDILSLPEASGGVDLATLVGALKTLTTLDPTGQTARTLRLVVQGIEGSADPNADHEARDAVDSLLAGSLTVQEGQKLVPALTVMIDKGVVIEFINLLHDLLYTCSPPPTTH